MKHITLSVLLQAIKEHVPIFEDGDSIDNEVFLFMTDPKSRENTKFTNNEKAFLLSKVSSGKVLIWITKCSSCGKDLQIAISKTYLSNGTNAIDTLIGKFSTAAYFHKHGKRTFKIDQSRMFYGNGHKNHVFCDDCLSNLDKYYQKTVDDYFKCDKLEFWRSVYNSRESLSDIREHEKIAKKYKHEWDLIHPFANMLAGFNIHDGKLISIVDAVDELYISEEKKISLDDLEEYGGVYSRHDYYEGNKYHMVNVFRYGLNSKPDNQIQPISIIRRHSDAQQSLDKSNTPRKINQQVEVPFMPGDTMEYIKYFATPTDESANIQDLTCLMSTEIDDMHLQTYLQTLLYRDFVRTRYWKTLVVRRKFIDGNVCTVCGSSKHLQVHHLTYEHHGDERHYMHELVTLCKTCHEKIHFEGNFLRPA